MRRDGRFWGWIMGQPKTNHLWSDDNTTDPPRLLALCGRSPIEVGGVSRPRRTLTDGATPPWVDRCSTCERIDQHNRRERRRAR